MLGQLLGAGAGGSVWRAVHEESGSAVALKRIVPAPGALHRLRREIATLAALGHPGIARIVDHGMDEDAPWVAMELVAGETLRARLASPSVATLPPPAGGLASWRGGALAPDAERELIAVVARLCGPLRYLHGEGIVHGDLKPDNVVVRPGGSPVIVDFGLATAWMAGASREALDALHAMPGTFWYTAPEQARGDVVDARADLYALGCILYEILTGAPPFLGSDPMEVLAMHAEVEPPPPSRLRAGLPASVDRLVMRLLAKSPASRPGYADDVARMLREAGLGARADRGPRPSIYLYRPGLAGREPILAELDAALDRLEAGRGGVLFLGGETGCGKTKLALHLAGRARSRRLPVLSGACAAQGSILAGLRQPLQAIADHCREGGASETARLLGDGAAVLAAIEPSFRNLPGTGSPGLAPPETTTGRIRNVLHEAFASLAHRRPLVLLMDDVHAADDLTLEVIGSFVDGGAPLLCVATFRTDEEAPGTLARLLTASTARVLHVGRLREADTARVVSEMLAIEAPPAPLVTEVQRRSEGNPFVAGELLRAAVAIGALRRDDQGTWQLVVGDALAPVPLPGTLRTLIAHRLDGLGVEARALVEAAAILDASAERDLVATVAGVTAAAPWAEVLRRDLLEETADGHLRLTHGIIGEVAREALGARRARELHLAAASWLDALPPGERSERLFAMARHWQHAGEPLRARDAYLAAALHARERHAVSDAVASLRAHLALPAPLSRDRVTARRDLGRCLLVVGACVEAHAAAEEAFEEARTLRDGPLEASCLAVLGDAACELDRAREARLSYQQGLRLARDAGDVFLEASLLLGVARAERLAGRTVQAKACYEQALAIHERHRDVAAQGNVLVALASLLVDLGGLDEASRCLETALVRLESAGHPEDRHALSALAALQVRRHRLSEARALFERALGSHRKHGDRLAELQALANLAALAEDDARAEPLLLESLRLAREVGKPGSELRGLVNLGILRLRQRRLAQARDELARAVELARELGQPREEAVAAGNLGVACRELGQPEEAGRLFVRAIELSRRTGDRFTEGVMLGNLAGVHYLRGRVPEARAAGEAALLIHREVGDRHSEALALLNLGQLERQVGRLDTARALLQEAGSLADAAGAGELSGACAVHLGLLERDASRLPEASDLLRRGAEAAAAGSDRALEGLALAGLAGIAREEGALGDAARLLDRAEELAAETDASVEALEVLAERGLMAAALGEDGTAFAGRAEALLARLGGEEAGPAGAPLRRLRGVLGRRPSELPRPS